LEISESFPESVYLLSQIAKYATGRAWTDCPQISEEAIDRIISGTNLE
jgi:hypothetical protein